MATFTFIPQRGVDVEFVRGPLHEVKLTLSGAGWSSQFLQSRTQIAPGTTIDEVFQGIADIVRGFHPTDAQSVIPVADWLDAVGYGKTSLRLSADDQDALIEASEVLRKVASLRQGRS